MAFHQSSSSQNLSLPHSQFWILTEKKFADPVCIFTEKKFRIIQICRKSEPYNSWKCFQIIRAQNLPKIEKSKNGLGEWYIYIYTYIYLIEVDSGHLSRLVQPGTGHQRTRQCLRRERRSLETVRERERETDSVKKKVERREGCLVAGVFFFFFYEKDATTYWK